MFKPYGKELVLDLHDCDPETFGQDSLDLFFGGLGELTGMELCTRYFWTMDECPEEWRTVPHLNGTSAVQFISTSSFVIHTLTDLRAVYLNVFTCKDFDPKAAEEYARDFFRATVASATVIVRV